MWLVRGRRDRAFRRGQHDAPDADSHADAFADAFARAGTGCTRPAPLISNTAADFGRGEARSIQNATNPTKLAVVLLNYQTPELVGNCIESLAPELSKPGRELVVVDNASGDESVVSIRRAIERHGLVDRARVIEAPRNGGFSYGHNRGIEASEADLCLLLNSDTLIRPGALDALVAAAEQDPTAGLVAPRLEWPDATPQESCFRYASPMSEFFAAARTGPLSALGRRFEVPLPVPQGGLEDVEWVSFAAVSIRREVLASVGPLDENYFMYFEDMDYCRRAREAGWKIHYAPGAHVVHLRGGSSSVKERFATRTRVPAYYWASRNRYFGKFYGGRLGSALANFSWIAGRGISKLREIVGSKSPHLAQRQSRDIWIGWNGSQPGLDDSSKARHERRGRPNSRSRTAAASRRAAKGTSSTR